MTSICMESQMEKIPESISSLYRRADDEEQLIKAENNLVGWLVSKIIKELGCNSLGLESRLLHLIIETAHSTHFQ